VVLASASPQAMRRRITGSTGSVLALRFAMELVVVPKSSVLAVEIPCLTIHNPLLKTSCRPPLLDPLPLTTHRRLPALRWVLSVSRPRLLKGSTPGTPDVAIATRITVTRSMMTGSLISGGRHVRKFLLVMSCHRTLSAPFLTSHWILRVAPTMRAQP
jgi:hypothetical protein